MAMEDAGATYHLPRFPGVRLIGLPFNCRNTDILRFLEGLRIVDILITNRYSSFKGDAFVVLEGDVEAELARFRHRNTMGRRYVEVVRCSRRQYYDAIVHGSVDLRVFTHVLKLRGLPYTVNKYEIMDFFQDFDVGEINIASRDGRGTGEAYVEFGTVGEARSAMRRDGGTIRNRYVQLFPSTPQEVTSRFTKEKKD